MNTRDKSIPVAEFKAKCLRIIDELGPAGVLITKRGRPVARVLPVTASDNAKLIGSMKGSIRIKGDIFSTGIEWNAESGHTHDRRRSERRSH
jgi:prevent-host-death family protein